MPTNSLSCNKRFPRNESRTVFLTILYYLDSLKFNENRHDNCLMLANSFVKLSTMHENVVIIGCEKSISLIKVDEHRDGHDNGNRR